MTKPKKDVTSADVPQEATASTDKLDTEKTMKAPADEQTVAVDTPPAAVIETRRANPETPSKSALPPSNTVNFDTVDYDQTGNIVFGGRGPAGSKVQLYVDNNAYGLAFINDKGTWTFAGLSPLAVGTHTIRAHEIGDDGAVKSRIEMPFLPRGPNQGCCQTSSSPRNA